MPTHEFPPTERMESSRRRLLIAGLAASGAVIATCLTTSHLDSDSAGEQLTPEAYACLEQNNASPRSMRAVDRWISEPPSRNFRQVQRKILEVASSLPTPDPNGSRLMETTLYPSKQVNKFIETEATKADLHVVNPEPYIMAVQKAKNPESAFTAFSAFGDRIGLPIVLHRQKDEIDEIKFTAFDEDNFADAGQLTYSLAPIIRSLAQIPTEIMTYANVTEVRIVNDLGDNINGTAVMDNRIIYIPFDVLKNGTSSVFHHEIAHMIDYVMSGPLASAQRCDASFEALNDGSFEYGAPTVDSTDYLDSTVSQYGATKVIEDKAEFMGAILDGKSLQNFEDYSATIQEKYRLLLARFEDAVPGYAHYAITTEIS